MTDGSANCARGSVAREYESSPHRLTQMVGSIRFGRPRLKISLTDPVNGREIPEKRMSLRSSMKPILARNHARCCAHFSLSSRISSASMYGYLSGIPNTTTRFPPSDLRNFRFNLCLWTFSMTMIKSAHSICSTESGTSASGASPAESTSIPGCPRKISSAVGLRSLLREQRKRTRFMRRG